MSTDVTREVKDRVQKIRARIEDCARSCDRSAEQIRLIAICKRQPPERVLAAYAAGLRVFGENTAQGLKRNEAVLGTYEDIEWHFVGALQRNKVNQVLSSKAWIHSVDRVSLAEAISRRAPESGVHLLIQVNLGGEEQKSGIAPGDVIAFAGEIAKLPRLRMRGLMTIPPAEDDPGPHFKALAALSRELQATPVGVGAVELSMGMSADFESAIRHGATMIRIGTALFGERPS